MNEYTYTWRIEGLASATVRADSLEEAEAMRDEAEAEAEVDEWSFDGPPTVYES